MSAGSESVDPSDIASAMPVDEQAGRHQRLLAVALEALVADEAGPEFGGSTSIPTAFGAAISNGSGQAWVILDLRERDPASLLGAVMAWAIRAEVQSLRIITDQESGTLARRAAHFDIDVSVWLREGRSLRPLSSEPLAPVPVADPRHLGFVEQISASGAAVAIEHGIVAGHVRGLEICRVVDDLNGAANLEVGVGANDRLAFSMLYEGVPVEESLRRVVAEVTAHRTVGAPRHPLNQLAKERFLRWHLEQNPELIGAHELTAVASSLPSRGLSFAAPCSAIGRSVQGQAMLVVCSVGIDLDLVPYAIDARLCVAGIDAWNQLNQSNQGSDSARLVIAVPSRDLIALQRDLAQRVARSAHWDPIEFVGLDWVSS